MFREMFGICTVSRERFYALRRWRRAGDTKKWRRPWDDSASREVAVQLGYESTFRMRCQLKLRCGRTVTLRSIEQTMTYAGLLIGAPTTEVNTRTIRQTLAFAKQRCVSGAEPHLIPPVRRTHGKSASAFTLRGGFHRALTDPAALVAALWAWACLAVGM
jgi:hypothetical protein